MLSLPGQLAGQASPPPCGNLPCTCLLAVLVEKLAIIGLLYMDASPQVTRLGKGARILWRCHGAGLRERWWSLLGPPSQRPHPTAERGLWPWPIEPSPLCQTGPTPH